MKLWLEVEGASEADIQRGLEAAEAVFKKTGVSPLQAVEGWFAMENWDIAGFPDDGSLTDEERRLAGVWLDAEDAAQDACLEGRDDMPLRYLGALQLLDD